MEISRRGNLTRIALIEHREFRSRVFAHELMLKLVHGVASWLIGKKIPLARVDFAYPRPGQATEYAYVYPGPALFDQPETALYLETADLEASIRKDKHPLREFLRRAPADWLVFSFSEGMVSHRVRDYLEPRLQRAIAVEGVARALHLSVRALCRRLAAEGTTFQAVKDELRRDVAIQRLARTSAPIATIAAGLGFDDSTTFHRAFKKWTGSTPGAYRRVAGSQVSATP